MNLADKNQLNHFEIIIKSASLTGKMSNLDGQKIALQNLKQMVSSNDNHFDIIWSLSSAE